MSPLITPEDLAPFCPGLETARAEAMIADAEAIAYAKVPALANKVLSPVQAAGIKAIFRRALVRWWESGSGAVTQQSETAGSYNYSQTIDTRTRGSWAIFTDSELADIAHIVDPQKDTGGAFTVKPTTGDLDDALHQPWCSITWGSWCSCGARLTGSGGHPLWEY